MQTMHDYRGFAHGNGYLVRPDVDTGYAVLPNHRCPSRIAGAGSGEGGEEPVCLTVITGVYHEEGLRLTIPFAVVEADPSTGDTRPAEALITAYKAGCVGATNGCVVTLCTTVAGEEPPRVVTLGLSDYIDPAVLAELIAAAAQIALDWLQRRYPKTPPKDDDAAMRDAWDREETIAKVDRHGDGTHPVGKPLSAAECSERLANLEAELVTLGYDPTTATGPAAGDIAADRVRWLFTQRDMAKVAIAALANEGN